MIDKILNTDDLHPALAEPALESMNFLNEIMKRYPNAISFAPGAPNLMFQQDFDYNRSIKTYLTHVAQTRNLTSEKAFSLLYEYGPAQGLICDIVAAALERDEGLQLHAEDVLITVGAQEAMFLSLRALFRKPEDQLAVVSPCYVGIRGAASLLNIDLVSVSETADGLDLDSLTLQVAEARKSGKSIRAIYVSPDHANPSGAVMSLAQRLQLLKLAEQENFYILEDSAYGFTADPVQPLPTLKALDRTKSVIFIGTFAKISLPGARVGFVVADQWIKDADGNRRTLAQAMASAKSMITVNTSPICQAVVGGMLIEHGGSLAELGKSKAEFYRSNLVHLITALDRELDPNVATWNRPTGGFFVLAQLSVPVNLALLEQCADGFDVLWTPMSQFYLDSAGDFQLRLSCSYLSHSQIDEGVKRLSKFIHSIPSGGIRSV